jgi:lipoate-protein ligase A
MKGWRLLRVPPRPGAENMARDAGLMDRARLTGEAVFSVYGWSEPTLSFGRNQTARDLYDRRAIESRGIGVVRRPTGGRALLHHREITYSVASPIAPGDSLSMSYAAINKVLIRGLHHLGVEVSESSGVPQSAPPGIEPCFSLPAAGELVTAEGKLVGSAQVRADGALLQHGSILVDDDQATITDLLLKREDEGMSPRPATLRATLGREVSLDEAADALFEAVAEHFETQCDPISADEVAEFTATHMDRFGSELWTWRR